MRYIESNELKKKKKALTQQTTFTLKIEYLRKHETSVRSRRYRFKTLFGMLRLSLKLVEVPTTCGPKRPFR